MTGDPWTAHTLRAVTRLIARELRSPISVEQVPAEAHPPKVTALGVLGEFGLGRQFVISDPVMRMAAHIADLRNAAREAPDDEAWIEVAVKFLVRECGLTSIGEATTRDAISEAYRARRRTGGAS